MPTTTALEHEAMGPTQEAGPAVLLNGIGGNDAQNLTSAHTVQALLGTQNGKGAVQAGRIQLLIVFRHIFFLYS